MGHEDLRKLDAQIGSELGKAVPSDDACPPPLPDAAYIDRSQAPASSPRDLGLIAFDDDQPNLDDAYLIEDVLPLEGFGVMFGPPGSGKTFMGLDIAFPIAGACNNWRDKYAEHGSVLFFGMEGGRSFGNRVEAYKRERGRAPHFYRSNVNLDLRSGMADAKAVIAEARRIGRNGRPVKLIVIDTLNRALAGGNENGPEDMGALVRLCEFIRKELGCFILVLHHSGKDEARGMRGHSSLLGAVDTELELKAGADGNTMTVRKQRDGEAGEQFGYRLRQVVIGTSTKRGKPVTSCVVEPMEASAPATPSLGPNQFKALEALRQYVADHGTPCPGGTGWPERGSRKIVPVADFLHFLEAKMVSNKPDSRRRMAERALKDLEGKRLTQTNEGSVWIIQ